MIIDQYLRDINRKAVFNSDNIAASSDFKSNLRLVIKQYLQTAGLFQNYVIYTDISADTISYIILQILAEHQQKLIFNEIRGINYNTLCSQLAEILLDAVTQCYLKIDDINQKYTYLCNLFREEAWWLNVDYKDLRKEIKYFKLLPNKFILLFLKCFYNHLLQNVIHNPSLIQKKEYILTFPNYSKLDGLHLIQKLIDHKRDCFVTYRKIIKYIGSDLVDYLIKMDLLELIETKRVLKNKYNSKLIQVKNKDIVIQVVAELPSIIHPDRQPAMTSTNIRIDNYNVVLTKYEPRIHQKDGITGFISNQVEENVINDNFEYNINYHLLYTYLNELNNCFITIEKLKNYPTISNRNYPTELILELKFLSHVIEINVLDLLLNANELTYSWILNFALYLIDFNNFTRYKIPQILLNHYPMLKNIVDRARHIKFRLI
jgi:hypothetical protein